MFELIVYINFICVFISFSTIRKQLKQLDEKIDSFRRLLTYSSNINDIPEIIKEDNENE